MESVIYFTATHPRLTALFSALSIVDAMTCVRLAHSDWWFLAVIALAAAALVRPQSTT